ncbi:MAG TPA: four-helix bundle copper-binding protein [Burkholderiales bacterium]|nr:four-helix bundle copper-binding protein [Burkholderiales bacterium]
MPEIVPSALDDRDHSRACIEACFHCARTCMDAVISKCLPMGGRHAEAQHLGLMLGCADLCNAVARYLLSTQTLKTKVCGACAEVCEACAHSCAELGHMDECVEACRRCAEACRRAGMGTAVQ